MALRIPKTLWWAVGWELARMITVTTLVVTVALAFATAVKPLADGKLEPLDALRYIYYAFPGMLVYALPFSGGFAATLVYHRLATDNELTAAQAGGIPLRAMLAPAILMAFAVGVTLIVLNDQMIPGFMRKMYRLVTTDIGRVMVNDIPNGRAVRIRNMQLLADHAKSSTPDPAMLAAMGASGPMPTSQVVLTRPVMLELDATGNVAREYYAESASLWFYPPARDMQRKAEIRVRLKNAVSGEGADQWRFEETTEGTIIMPDPFWDRPKFFTMRNLWLLRDHPERVNWVDEARRDLALVFARRQAERYITQTLTPETPLVLRDSRGGRIVIVGSGARVTPDGIEILPLPEGDAEATFIRIEQPDRPAFRTTGVSETANGQVWLARAARLHPIDSADAQSLTFDLRLERVRAKTGASASGGLGAERGVIPLTRLTLDNDPSKALLERSSRDLIESGHAASSNDPALVGPTQHLEAQIAKLRGQVVANMHERWAYSACSLVMVVCGAVTAVKHHRKTPLAVYLRTFLPALLCLVTVSGGSQTVQDSGGSGGFGLLLLWGGILALAIHSFFVYRTLARH